MDTKKQCYKKELLKKGLIINADDLGISITANQAILEGYTNGILNSTSLMVNMNTSGVDAFEDALKNILPNCPDMRLGIHLNIIEGKTVREKIKEGSLLYDRNGRYNNGFIALLLKSFNKNFLEEVEADFRLQIEKMQAHTKIDHIDSHVHVHAIPNVFKIVCKLAKDYGIATVRTQYEKPYFVPDLKKYLSLKYPINLIKVALLNFFTLINKKTLKDYSLDTNDFVVGVNYTGYMDKNTILYGIKRIKEENAIIEVIVHPDTDKNLKSNYNEYLAVLDKEIF